MAGDGGVGAEHEVVIVGGGFAGLNAARVLRDTPTRVTVIDRTNHHVFQPLLYQVATAVLNPGDVASPIRRAVRGSNITVLMDEVRRIDVGRKVVTGTQVEVHFDELILAAGASHSYFGHPEWARHAPGLKGIDDALEMRRRILTAFELAEREPEPARRRQLMTFVIVGGGPTGVELAGALADLARHALPGDFHNIDPKSARILLVEGTARLLSAWPEDLSARARRQLERLGVEVRTNALVTAVDAESVTVGAERIGTRTALWGAGVQASGLGRFLPVELDRAGRVPVTRELHLPGRQDIFVVGDQAALQVDGKPVPGLAPAAIQMGKHAAMNVLRRVRGQALAPFTYRDRGSFAVVGRGAAIGVLGRRTRVHLDGVVAWAAWLGIHILFLIGFRNRVSVLLGWMYAFFTHKRPTRLITGPGPYPAEDCAAEQAPAPAPSAAEASAGKRPAPPA